MQPIQEGHMQLYTQHNRMLEENYLTTSDCKCKTAHSWAKVHAANIHARVQHIQFS